MTRKKTSTKSTPPKQPPEPKAYKPRKISCGETGHDFNTLHQQDSRFLRCYKCPKIVSVEECRRDTNGLWYLIPKSKKGA